MATTFKPALIVVDVQEDFCPPNGSLAVPDGRAIIPTVNYLLGLPFGLKICTKDWHPADHISFATNHHDASGGAAQPFSSFTTVRNPQNANETYETRLWPVHCVQGTAGARLVPELRLAEAHRVLEKGVDARVEMYSAFYDPLKSPRCCDSGLAAALAAEAVTHVFVVGLAADYCVRFTAVDAAAEGFSTVIVEEGTRPVDVGAWEVVKEELKGKGVRVVSVDGEEVKRVVELGKKD